MNAKLIENPKALHNIIWISAFGLGILFIIMGLVLVVVGAEMNTKPVFGKLFVMGLLACAAGISAALYTVITRLGKQQTRNIFYSVSVLIIIIMFAGSLYFDTPSDIFNRALILWLLGLSALLVITGNVAGILLHRFD
jgi:predicted membrane channel-forming protein YqfA (hemolysin III family)